MRTCHVGLLLLLFATPLAAGKVQEAKVAYKDGIYSLELDMRLTAPFENVRAIVTDYEGLYRISEVLIESRLLLPPAESPGRRRLVTRVCILFFCFTAKMVEDLWESDDTITTRIVPAESDYSFGETVWEIEALDAEHSRITISSQLQPAFWVPPLIGPYLMKQKMMSEAKKSIYSIEALAADD